MDKCSNVLVAVARRVFDLLADFSKRLALPCHLDRREVPHRMSRHARGIKIGSVMAGAALQARRAVAINAADDPRLVRPHVVGLGRAVTGWMTVHAARVGDYFARFLEQGYGAFTRIGRWVTNPPTLKYSAQFNDQSTKPQHWCV
jgi:hypothetical protein